MMKTIKHHLLYVEQQDKITRTLVFNSKTKNIKNMILNHVQITNAISFFFISMTYLYCIYFDNILRFMLLFFIDYI